MIKIYESENFRKAALAVIDHFEDNILFSQIHLANVCQGIWERERLPIMDYPFEEEYSVDCRFGYESEMMCMPGSATYRGTQGRRVLMPHDELWQKQVESYLRNH